MNGNKPKILVIVGPTASGKTSLSIELALKYNGEIISADSRQVYKGLDLGTGKVTKEEMKGVPHHLLDVANPQDTYTVASFVHDGRAATTDILSRNKLPIIVGGTFLYIDALLGKVSTPEVIPDKKLRDHLETLDTSTLFDILLKKDPARAHTIDSANKRRLIRALEIVETLGVVPETHIEHRYDSLTLGISISKEQLRENIHARLLKRISDGMIEEVEQLHQHGLSYDRLYELGLEYRYIAAYLQNEISKEEMLLSIETKSMQYAKRQMTWLKRDEDIVWFEARDIEGIEKVVTEFLE